MIQSYYNFYPPITFLPSVFNTAPITFDIKYIENLKANGILDNYSPLLFIRHPLFTQLNEFHQNIGILQTAYNSLEKIYTLIDELKKINNPSKEIIKTYENQINDIVKNSSFNNINVFEKKITINDKTIDLNIPKFAYENLNKFEESVIEKENLIKTYLTSELTPFNEKYNINLIQSETLKDIINAPISNSFKLELLNPEIVNLLLS